MSLVLDASMTLAWCFEDEREGRADLIMDQVGASGAWVPGLWRLEVANALRIAVRKGRMTNAQMSDALASLAGADISVDAETSRLAWTTTFDLAERFDLTLYDAAYLELADRRRLPLASLDRALCAAAQRAGVALC